MQTYTHTYRCTHIHTHSHTHLKIGVCVERWRDICWEETCSKVLLLFVGQFVEVVFAKESLFSILCFQIIVLSAECFASSKATRLLNWVFILWLSMHLDLVPPMCLRGMTEQIRGRCCPTFFPVRHLPNLPQCYFKLHCCTQHMCLWWFFGLHQNQNVWVWNR